MTLVIDGIDPLIVKLLLFHNETLVKHEFEAQRNLSERLPTEIAKFIKKQKVDFSQIKKVAVTSGPGHFSRVRTCVAVANALAYSRNLPVIPLTNSWQISDLAQKGEKQVKPFYDKAPNITLPKAHLTK